MRRHPMPRTTLHRTFAVAATAAALLLAGCGSQDGGGEAGGSVSPSPSQSQSPPQSQSPTPSDSASQSTSPSSSPSPTGSAGSCTPRTQLDATDNGRTVCLAKGQTLRLTLDGTKGRPWKPVAVEGGALKAANPGFVIQPGDAVAAFEAVAPGTAHLTSSRPLCASRPGQMSCKGIQDWKVTVEVR
ncbi:hypothetical protein ABZ915_05310 [Streptomyces sp. NPDC046915]|uniref:hypothetical protein n=1 Tax=Streptomyces sp. NPDC046915 TaxID=3155257 RepID=UPI0033DCB513